MVLLARGVWIQLFPHLESAKKQNLMQRTLIKNIDRLLGAVQKPRPLLRGKALAELPECSQAWLLIEADKVVSWGSMKEAVPRADVEIDAAGGCVLPAFVDSHTHLVFAAWREEEFVLRLRGKSYEEIARAGGGILHSAARLRNTSEEELYEQALQRMEEVRSLGTAALEIKSGYGLEVESEWKMLRVIRRLKEASAAPIKATFLGAHALPLAYKNKREAYLKLVVEEMLPRIAAEGLADYVDVFCEKVAFSVGEMERILEASAKYGLKPKVHVNQFHAMGGVEAAVRQGAISVDHLEVVSERDLQILAKADTLATILPSAPFFLNDHYPPARKMVDRGVALALATDYNPGSSPSGRMAFSISLACIKCGLLPEEALNAATVNGAHALELEQLCGSIAPGMRADLILTRPIPSPAFIPYAFGSDVVEKVFIGGR